MRSARSACFALLILCLFASLPLLQAQAQTPLDDIQKAVSQDAAELAQIDTLLASADKNIRTAAVQRLLQSDNPVYVQRAREAALFSSDPAMRLAVLKAIFDKGGTFKLVLNLKGLKEEETRASEWLSNVGGTWNPDGTSGEYTFSTDPYNPKFRCWPFQQASNCAFSQAGENIALPGWRAATGNLKLGQDGKLKGVFQTHLSSKGGAPIPAEIDLSE